MTFDPTSPWPELPLEAWRTTRDTLHMWTQIVGKTRLRSRRWRTTGGTRRSASAPAA